MSAECVGGQSWLLQSQSVLCQCISASRASALPETLAPARTKGVAVTMRFAIPAAAMLLLSGFTKAELEKAKSTTEFFKDAYWKCLADEILRAVPTNMSTQEFSVLTKSACPKERNYFFNSLSNYIVMLQPDVDRSTVAPAANIAVLEAQKDAVQALNDLRSGKRQMPPQPR
jgi:hypothetical protein